MSNIVLAITGGIAAYKSAIFARLLIKAGFDVRVIMTTGAQAFITPLKLQALTGNEVHVSLLDEKAEAGMGHIELAKWADLIVIAPASANTLARLAMGMADDLLTTVCLATTAPVMIAPAMNQQMWAHPAVHLNVQTLRDMNYYIIQPASGEQACGDVGAGRLPEPEQLLAEVLLFTAMQTTPQLLTGKRVVITAGPTVEAIDPVRCRRSGCRRHHRHGVRDRPLQAGHRGSFRQGLRAGKRTGSARQERDAGIRAQHDSEEHQLHLHPPGRGAGVGACGAVRQAGDR